MKKLIPILMLAAMLGGCNGGYLSGILPSAFDGTLVALNKDVASNPAKSIPDAALYLDIAWPRTTINWFAFGFSTKNALYTPQGYNAVGLLTAWVDEANQPGRVASADMPQVAQALALCFQNMGSIHNGEVGKSAMALIRVARAMKAKGPLRAVSSGEITDLLNSVPEQYRPWIQDHAVELLNLTATQLAAALKALLAGDVVTAYRTALKGMSEAQLVAELGNLILGLFTEANRAYSSKIATEKLILEIVEFGFPILFPFIL